MNRFKVIMMVSNLILLLPTTTIHTMESDDWEMIKSPDLISEQDMQALIRLASQPHSECSKTSRISDQIKTLEKIQNKYPCSEIDRMIQLKKDECRIAILMISNVRQHQDKNHPDLQSLVTEMTTISNEMITIMPTIERLQNKYFHYGCPIS